MRTLIIIGFVASILAVTITPGAGECRDSEESCAAWAARGDCQTNKWMLKNCKSSCNLCNECVDEEEDCAAWARRGDCRANPTWMLRHCRVSCGNCPNQDYDYDMDAE